MIELEGEVIRLGPFLGRERPLQADGVDLASALALLPECQARRFRLCGRRVMVEVHAASSNATGC